MPVRIVDGCDTREISAAVELAESTADTTLDRLELAERDPGGVRPSPRSAPRTRGSLLLARVDARVGSGPAWLSCRNRTQPAVSSTCPAPDANHASRANLVGRGVGFGFGVKCQGGRNSAKSYDTKLIKLAIRSVSETASTVGGLGVSASVAALLEGVLNVMRIKKLALTGAGLVALGTLGLVIANRTAAVGGSPYQESVPRGDEPLVREVGSDGGAIGSPKAIPRTQFVTQTYYVGDILGEWTWPARRSVSVPGQPATEVRPVCGHETAHGFYFLDRRPRHLANGELRREGRRRRIRTSWFPFMLSISLIIRCSPEVHDQVANTLRGLRVLLQARDERTLPSPAEPPKSPQAVYS